MIAEVAEGAQNKMVLKPKEVEAIAGPGFRKLLKAVKHPDDLVRAWLPELFKVPYLPKRREREGWIRARNMKALPDKLTTWADDVEFASRSARVFLSAPLGYPPGIIGALAQQMRQGAEFLRKAMSGPDLAPKPSVRAVRICGLLEWIKIETGRYYYAEVACLLDLAFLAATEGNEGGPDPAELKMMLKRTSSSLRQNVAGIVMKWANDPELPEDFRELMLHAALETDPVPPRSASRPNVPPPGKK
ncbi:MAG TPA: hypothetical protein VKM93_02300 [Terriglobia bacterium]|nr:hypothetical protein [Terriglobia bacterium]